MKKRGKWTSNKKAIAKVPLITIIIAAALVLIVFFIIPSIGVCDSIDSFPNLINKTPINPEGAVFQLANHVQSSYLDPSFQYLFGNTFKSSVKWFAGYKGVCESIVSFRYHFILGLIALFWIALSTFIVNMFFKLYRFGNKYWDAVLNANRLTILKYAGLLLIYPTLMQIAIINRFIEIITFYYFTNWLIYSFILAIYVGWLPKFIEGAIYFIEYYKANKRIFQFKEREAKVRALTSK